MDARSYLQRQGWQEGNSLGISGNGIKKPLLISFKDNALGIGSKKQKEKQADQWWLRAFDTALKDFGTGKQSTLDQVTKLGVGRGGLYGFFVKGESLRGTIDDDVVSDASSILIETEASLPASTMSIPTPAPVVDETKKSKKRKIEDSEAVVEPKKSKKSKKDKAAVADSELFTIDVVGTTTEPKKDNAEVISLDIGEETKAEPKPIGKLKKTKRGKDGRKKREEEARIVENAGGPPRPETENERMRREKKERKKEEKAARRAFKQANKIKPIDPVTITSFDGKDKSLTQCKKAVKKWKAHIKKQSDDPSEGNLAVEAELAQVALDSIATLSEYLKKAPRVRAARLAEFELPKQRRDNAKNEYEKVCDMAHGFDGHIRNIEKKLKPTQPKSLAIVEQLKALVVELKEMQADAQKEHETRAAEYRVADGRDPNAEKIKRQAKALAKRNKKIAERLAKSGGQPEDVDMANGADATAPAAVEVEGVISLDVPAAAAVPADENGDTMTGLHPARLAMLAREPSPPAIDHRGSSHAYKKKIPGKKERKALKAAKKGGKPPRRKRN